MLSLAKVPKRLLANAEFETLDKSMQTLMGTLPNHLIHLLEPYYQEFTDKQRYEETTPEPYTEHSVLEDQGERIDYRYREFSLPLGESIMLNHALFGGLLYGGATPLTDDPFHNHVLDLKLKHAMKIPTIRQVLEERGRQRQLKADVLSASALTDTQLKLPILSPQLRLEDILEAGAGLGGFGFNVETKFRDSVKKAATGRKINLLSMQKGGKDPTQPTDVDQMVDKAVNFAVQVKEIADKYQVDLEAYTILDIPDINIDLQQQKGVLESLSRFRTPLLAHLNDIDFMLLNPHQFEKPGTDLNNLRKEIATVLDALQDQASRCLNSQDCKNMIDVTIPDTSGLPERVGPRGTGPNVVVPALIGLELGEAESQVQLAGLQLEKIPVLDDHNRNRVSSQTPAPFSSVPPNSKVTVTFGGDFSIVGFR
jgi:hypothetical protein